MPNRRGSCNFASLLWGKEEPGGMGTAADCHGTIDAALAKAETPLVGVSAEPRAEASDMEHEGLRPLERETRGCR